MATYERLTDRTIATGVTLNDLIHIVITGDTSQNAAGSSYKATVQQVANAITSTIGIGLFLPLSGGTVTGGTIFTSGVTANTLNISSTPTTDQTNTNILVRDSSTGLINQKTIPNTLSYGLFTQTGNTDYISGTSEQSIIDGGLGTLTVGANQFQVGDTFHAEIKGHLSSNNDFLQFRVKADSVVLADSTSIQYNTSGDDTLMTLDLYFVIRQTGTTGNAEILTKGFLRTIKNSNFSVNGYSFEDINNTTFDTTISNTLDITIQFDATDPQTYIYTDLIVLNKLY